MGHLDLGGLRLGSRCTTLDAVALQLCLRSRATLRQRWIESRDVLGLRGITAVIEQLSPVLTVGALHRVRLATNVRLSRRLPGRQIVGGLLLGIARTRRLRRHAKLFSLLSLPLQGPLLL